MSLGSQTRFCIDATRISTEAGLEYRNVNIEVRKKIRPAKEEWTGEQCKNKKKAMMSENSKEVYNALKAVTKTQQPKSAVTEHSSGNILTESTVVLNW